LSVSFIATLGEAQRAPPLVEAEVRTLLADEAEVVLPYRTDVFGTGAPLAAVSTRAAAPVTSMVHRLGDVEQVVGQRNQFLECSTGRAGTLVIEREVAPAHCTCTN
jgi:hypothetical protein